MEKQRSDFICTKNNLTTNKKMRKCDLGNVDQALLEWFKGQRNAGLPINGPILKVQAEKFAKQLGHENFTCNNGWLDRFKNRHNIVYAKVSGEALSVDSKQQVNGWKGFGWSVNKHVPAICLISMQLLKEPRRQKCDVLCRVYQRF
jgi:hypothetical protein